jgi:hypothetical protein
MTVFRLDAAPVSVAMFLIERAESQGPVLGQDGQATM